MAVKTLRGLGPNRQEKRRVRPIVSWLQQQAAMGSVQEVSVELWSRFGDKMTGSDDFLRVDGRTAFEDLVFPRVDG